jgi:(heptosyl)LPS beta-1,4-glucosyltransferase
MTETANPTLGVVTISYNEERDLPGFLANLLDWVDEIVIVDDGSSDRTEEMARAAGDKVKFLRSPRNAGEYFSHQRNKGIAAAESDWLLHMDIDERVPPALARQVREAITDPTKDGYRYRRLNYFMHRPMKGGGWRDWNLVHLARREKFHFGGMFHETCILDAPNDRVGQLSALMVHFNEDNLEKRFRKSGTYLEELVNRVEARPRPVGFIDIAGRPVAEFLRKYVAKKGILDGIPGFISAVHAATAIFRANAVVWDRQNAVSREEIEADFARKWKAGQD